MKLVDKLKGKMQQAAAKSVNAYLEYQAMMKQPTIYQGFNDGFTRIMPETLSEDKTSGLTCCCKEQITKGQNVNETGDDFCPICKRTILFEEVQQRPEPKK